MIVHFLKFGRVIKRNRIETVIFTKVLFGQWAFFDRKNAYFILLGYSPQFNGWVNLAYQE